MSDITAIIGIAQLITENEASNTSEYLYDCGYVPGVETIRMIYERDGIIWSPLVEHDVLRISSGNDPEYFLTDFDWATLYRQRRNIELQEPSSGFVSGEDTFAEARKVLARSEEQMERLGITLHQFGHGYACFAEAKHFYESQEWQNKAKAVRYMGRYTCAICNRRNVSLHAHHNTPIVSAYHHNFHLNFADYKLEALCENCHREFHERTVRSTAMYGFYFAGQSEIKEEKEEFRLLRKVHDVLRFCPFCFGYRPGWDEMYMNWPESVKE